MLWNGESAAQRKPLAYEQINRPKIMSPWEIRRHVDYVLDHAPGPSRPAPSPSGSTGSSLVGTAHGRSSGHRIEGLPTYRALIQRIRGDLISWNAQDIMLQNEQPLGVDHRCADLAKRRVPGSHSAMTINPG